MNPLTSIDIRRPWPRLGRIFLTAALVATSFVPTAEAATQNSYRWRNDDGSEAAATWAAAENTAVTNFTVGETKRLRFGVSGGASDSSISVEQSVPLQVATTGGTTLIDEAAGYGYYGYATNNTFSRVDKFRLSDLSVVNSLILPATLGGAFSGRGTVIDTVAGYIYTVSYTQPANVIRIHLSDFATFDVQALPTTALGIPQTAALDHDGGHLYISLFRPANRIMRIRLSDFTIDGQLDMTEGGVTTDVRFISIDVSRGYLYYLSNGSPAIFGRISLATFLDAGFITTSLLSGQNLLVDSTSGIGYAVAVDGSSNRKAIRINLDGMAEVSGNVNLGVINVRSIINDKANDQLLFALSATPVIMRVGISGWNLIDSTTLATGTSFGFGVTYSAPIIDGRIYLTSAQGAGPYRLEKISVAAHPNLRLEAAPKSGSCTATSSGWQPVSAGSSPFKLVDTAYVNGGAATSNIVGGVTDGNSSFNAGRFVSASSPTSGAIGLGKRQFSEVEFAVTPALGVTSGASYCFRVTDAGAPLAAYSAIAEAKVATVSTNAATQTSVVGDASPSVDAVVPSDASGSGSVALPAAGFTLNEGATRTLYVRGTVSDQNGCNDLNSLTISVYRSGVSGAAACTPDNNDCYTAAVVRSSLSGCSGAGDMDATFEVAIPVASFADPTDAGSPHDADTWKASATATDAAGATGTFAADFEVQSLAALSVAPATMDYGTINLGATSSRQTLTFTNVGNRSVNSYVRADGPMHSSLAGFADIPTGAAHFSVSPAVAWAAGSILAVTDTDLPIALPQQVADAGPAPTAPAYFYLKLPATGIRGTYTNTLFFTAYAH